MKPVYGDEKIDNFVDKYYQVHYAKIPTSEIDNIDWYGYYPCLDEFGKLNGVIPAPCDEDFLILYDSRDGSEWGILLEDCYYDYDEDRYEPPFGSYDNARDEWNI